MGTAPHFAPEVGPPVGMTPHKALFLAPFAPLHREILQNNIVFRWPRCDCPREALSSVPHISHQPRVRSVRTASAQPQIHVTEACSSVIQWERKDEEAPSRISSSERGDRYRSSSLVVSATCRAKGGTEMLAETSAITVEAVVILMLIAFIVGLIIGVSLSRPRVAR